MKSSLTHLAIWLSVCVAALAGYGFWYAAIAHKSIAVADLQNQIDAKTESSSRVAFARTALAEIASDEALVQSHFVPETGVVSFIDDLETRARRQATIMKVTSVSLSGTAKKPILVLALVIEGTFDAVMRTIGTIEYAPYDLSLSKLSLGKGEKNWNANLEIAVGSVPAGTASSTPPRTP